MSGRIHKLVLFVVAAMTALLSASAAHADCKPLTLVTSVDLQPVKYEDKLVAELVPTTLNGKSSLLLLDTGGFITEVTDAVADKVGGVRRKGRIQVIDVTGDASDIYITADVKMGQLTADDMPFVVAKNGGLMGDADGLIGADVLKNYDTEIDFGVNKLLLLSQDHCEGKVIHWPASAVAVVPIQVLESGHILLPVSVDGHSVIALLDTGAAMSTMSIVQAESMGVKLGSDDAPEIGNLADHPGLHTYKHSFKSLDFEGIAVGNPNFEIITDRARAKVRNAPELGTRIQNADYAEDQARMLLGMNILRHFHIYIAYKEKKLYITPAEAPPPAQ